MEPPPALPIVPPPIPGVGNPDNRCWSDGPSEESANRWSSVSPLGEEESSPSVSVSQNSILSRGLADDREEPLPCSKSQAGATRPLRSPLVRTLLALALFLAALIGVVVLARSIRPWLNARRDAARRATVEYWLPRLEDGSDDARQEAARAIVGLGPQAVVKTLEQISHDPGNRERFVFVAPAVHAMAAIGADAVPGLCEGLRSPEAEIRAAAAGILAEMSRPGLAARNDLIAALADENRWVRCDAIDALGRFGNEGGPAAKRLAAMAWSSDANEVRHVIDALGHIGPAALDALPTLEKIAADHPDAILRSRASRAALQIDVQRQAAKARRKATGELKELLQAVLSDDARAAIAAAKRLGDMELAAVPAAVGLAAMLHRDDPARRAAAAAALGKIGLGATEYVPTLESAAADDDPRVRAAVAEALKQLNPKPR